MPLDEPMSTRTRLARTVDVAKSSASLVPSMWGVVAVSALGILSFLTRKAACPSMGSGSMTRGWRLEPSSVAREILDVGSSHPSFTMLLMGVHRLGDGSLRQLGVPSLVAGVLAPPIVYLVLRTLSYSRSVCFLMASALVVARTHILYSGRVKPYTLDLLGALLLARHSLARPPYVAVAPRPRMGALRSCRVDGERVPSRRNRGSGTGARDAPSVRPRALVAVALQAAAQVIYVRVLQSRTDMAEIERAMETLWDGHMTFSLNPADLVREASTHLGHVAQVYPAGPHGCGSR